MIYLERIEEICLVGTWPGTGLHAKGEEGWGEAAAQTPDKLRQPRQNEIKNKTPGKYLYFSHHQFCTLNLLEKLYYSQ